jgi:isocitrate dehydrogenase (NAD+)
VSGRASLLRSALEQRKALVASVTREASRRGARYAVFEPTHGSAPKYAGLNKVNPLSKIEEMAGTGVIDSQGG